MVVTEVLVRGGHATGGYWKWYGRMLCPICRAARLDWLTMGRARPQLVHRP